MRFKCCLPSPSKNSFPFSPDGSIHIILYFAELEPVSPYHPILWILIQTYERTQRTKRLLEFISSRKNVVVWRGFLLSYIFFLPPKALAHVSFPNWSIAWTNYYWRREKMWKALNWEELNMNLRTCWLLENSFQQIDFSLF